MRRVVLALAVGLGIGVGVPVKGADITTTLSAFLTQLAAGSIRMADGDASAPAYAFTSSTNSGVFLGSGDAISFAVGGTNRLDVNTTGLTFNDGKAFASLGTPANGTITYCTDCTIASPCAALGTGALAKRLNGAWICN